MDNLIAVCIVSIVFGFCSVIGGFWCFFTCLDFENVKKENKSLLNEKETLIKEMDYLKNRNSELEDKIFLLRNKNK